MIFTLKWEVWRKKFFCFSFPNLFLSTTESSRKIRNGEKYNYWDNSCHLLSHFFTVQGFKRPTFWTIYSISFIECYLGFYCGSKLFQAVLLQKIRENWASLRHFEKICEVQTAFISVRRFSICFIFKEPQLENSDISGK